MEVNEEQLNEEMPRDNKVAYNTIKEALERELRECGDNSALAREISDKLALIAERLKP